MQVIEVTEFGGPEVLRLAKRDDPVPSPGEILVRIATTNVNPTDIGARSGEFRALMPELRPPFVLGWDLAGEVAAVGPEVSGYAVGDRVVGMVPFARIHGRSGTYAEAASVRPEWLAPISDDVDDATAATLPLNGLTAHRGLELLELRPGSTLLVTGASGAVGAFATQLAVRAGHHVLAVASYDDEDWVGSLGAAEVVPRESDLGEVGPVDALFDAVPIGPSAAAPVRRGGTALFTRMIAEDLDPVRGVRKQVVLVNTDPAALREMGEDLAAGRLKTRVARVVDLADAAEAHRLVEAGGLRGKVVLTT